MARAVAASWPMETRGACYGSPWQAPRVDMVPPAWPWSRCATKAKYCASWIEPPHVRSKRPPLDMQYSRPPIPGSVRSYSEQLVRHGRRGSAVVALGKKMEKQSFLRSGMYHGIRRHTRPPHGISVPRTNATVFLLLVLLLAAGRS